MIVRVKIVNITFFKFIILYLCEYKAPKPENNNIENITVEEENTM